MTKFISSEEGNDAQRLVEYIPPLFSEYVHESFVNSIRKTRIFLMVAKAIQSFQGLSREGRKGDRSKDIISYASIMSS